MPEMEELATRHADAGLTVIAINYREEQGDIASYVDRLGLTFDIGFDPAGSVGVQYRVAGLPTHFFIDAGGILRKVQYGPMDRETMEEHVSSLLGRDMPAPGAR
jgi:hypothetical protein